MRIALCLALATAVLAEPPRAFRIDVVDEESGRGVPLVTLATTGQIRYVTDSAGVVAFDEPGLLGKEVYFHVWSHGYEHAADGFGFRGVRLAAEAGGRATVRVRRTHVAERVARLTGAGRYRDTILVGGRAPVREPLLSGDVVGQDSVLAIPYRGRLHWFWGDTVRPQYPLGNFAVSGATTELRVDPERGIDFEYFVGRDGFCREMCPLPGEGAKWIDGLMRVADGSGRERLVARFDRVRALGDVLERGLVVYDDAKQAFEKLVAFELDAPLYPFGHPLRVALEGREYFYFGAPFPSARVPATWDAIVDPSAYEALTPEGWRQGVPRATAATDAERPPERRLWHLADVDTGRPVRAHAGSVAWNAHRGRFVAIFTEEGGTSFLGEVWYAEADHLLGPWVYARKIATHDRYSFYNPKHHPYFDREGGRVIYFEGTYAATFSGNENPTPRYDYNQILYRLDLDDPRSRLPVPVYRARGAGGRESLATKRDVKDWSAVEGVAFFALDRPRPGSVDLGGFHGLPGDSPPSPVLVPYAAGLVWRSPVAALPRDLDARVVGP
jgi:hypothetical protein